MPATIRFDGTTVDAPDPLALARFYADITGGTVTGDGDEAGWAAAVTPTGMIGFQRVADYRPPRWPTQEVPQQMHLDFYVEDLEGAAERVLAAGATRLDVQPNDHCLVFTDPAGHPFCLSTWSGDDLVGVTPAG